MKTVFLDNASTTKTAKVAIDAFVKYSTEEFYNPSAEYAQSVNVSKKIEEARDFILKRLGASSGTIVFTSGATESNNLAIFGSLREGETEYIFSSGEHSSIFNVAKTIENNGKKVHFVPLLENGEIDYSALGNLVNNKTRLVSLIYVSNETGVVNDIKKAVEIIKEKNKRTLVHVDGVQAFNKIPFSVDDLNIDFLSYSAHKFHGVKGTGGLYVRNINALKSLVFGGGQEFNKRSGTENVGGILSSVEVMKTIDIKKNFDIVKSLKKIAVDFFSNKENVKIVATEGSPYILSLAFYGVNGETLMRALEKFVIVGKGSACGSKTAGNRVLKAIGLDDNRIKSSIRLSFDYEQTEEEIRYACEKIYEVYCEIYNKVK